MLQGGLRGGRVIGSDRVWIPAKQSGLFGAFAVALVGLWFECPFFENSTACLIVNAKFLLPASLVFWCPVVFAGCGCGWLFLMCSEDAPSLRGFLGGGGFLSVCRCLAFMESLILAQDERWRRA